LAFCVEQVKGHCCSAEVGLFVTSYPNKQEVLEVIWTPGHSPGHICLYEPQNQLLFAGDHILPKITPNISYHVQSGDNPLGDFLYALQKVQNLPVTKVLPAHEHVFRDLRGRIEEIRKHHDRRIEEIHRTIQEKPRVAYEIASQMTWDIPDLTCCCDGALAVRLAGLAAMYLHLPPRQVTPGRVMHRPDTHSAVSLPNTSQ